jgi:hypothetical protein
MSNIDQTNVPKNPNLKYVLISIGIIVLTIITYFSYQAWEAKDLEEYSSLIYAASKQSGQARLDILDNAMNRWNEYAEIDGYGHRLRGLSLLALDRRSEAILEFEKSIVLGNDAPVTTGHLLNGDTAKALSRYAKILTEEKSWSDTIFTRLDILLARAAIYESMGNYSLAVADADSVSNSARINKQYDKISAAKIISDRIYTKVNSRKVTLKIERFITPYGVPIEGTMSFSIVILGTEINMGEVYHQDYRKYANNYRNARITAIQIPSRDGKSYQYKDVRFELPSKEIEEDLPSFRSTRSPN